MSADVVSGPRRLHQSALWLALSVACMAVLLSASGAFDTDDLSWAHRLTLWSVVAGLCVGQAAMLDDLCRKALGGDARWLAPALALLITALLMTLELHALKYTPLLPKAPDPLLEFFVFVAPPVVAMGGLGLVVRRVAPLVAEQVESARAAPAAPSDWPAGAIYTIQAFDHYLAVTTAAGQTLLRARMSDAAERLAGADGLQVHRSWWVAREQVRAVRREGRDYKLVLAGGGEAPVARSRVAALRDAGWL